MACIVFLPVFTILIKKTRNKTKNCIYFEFFNRTRATSILNNNKQKRINHEFSSLIAFAFCVVWCSIP